MASESQKTAEAESKATPAYERELKAIVFALAEWRPPLLGTEVTADSDHATLARMMTQKQVAPGYGIAWTSWLSSTWRPGTFEGDLTKSRTRSRDAPT